MRSFEEEPLPVKIAYWVIFVALVVMFMFPLIEKLISLYPPRQSLIETIIGTFIAAAAGTYGAQVVIEKTKNKEMLIEEIRNTNAAIMLAFDACNTFLSLKKQHVKSLEETYAAQLNTIGNLPAPPPGYQTLIDLQLDFRSLMPMVIPADLLQKTVYEKISLSGRPLSLIIALIRAKETLNHCIENRNKFITDFKSNPAQNEEGHADRMALYLGIPNREGHVDTSYSDALKGIVNSTDDCIQFSKWLCEDLSQHGLSISKRFGKDAPKVHKPDFSLAANNGLMPDIASYKDWETAFPKQKYQDNT